MSSARAKSLPARAAARSAMRARPRRRRSLAGAQALAARRQELGGRPLEHAQRLAADAQVAPQAGERAPAHVLAAALGSSSSLLASASDLDRCPTAAAVLKSSSMASWKAGERLSAAGRTGPRRRRRSPAHVVEPRERRVEVVEPRLGLVELRKTGRRRSSFANREVDRAAVVDADEQEAQRLEVVRSATLRMVTTLPSDFDIFSPSKLRMPLCIQ